MACLYRSDYGPSDPSFDPLGGGGALIKGFEAHLSDLAAAHNIGQLQAIERKLLRGETVGWCDQGYGWAEQPMVQDLMIVAAIALILPYALWKLRMRRSPHRASGG
jgi:hypothetical protein